MTAWQITPVLMDVLFTGCGSRLRGRGERTMLQPNTQKMMHSRPCVTTWQRRVGGVYHPDINAQNTETRALVNTWLPGGEVIHLALFHVSNECINTLLTLSSSCSESPFSYSYYKHFFLRNKIKGCYLKKFTVFSQILIHL